MTVPSLILVASLAFGLSWGLNFQDEFIYQANPLSGPYVPQQDCRWKGAFRANDKCYYVEENKQDWRTSQNFCSHLGGKLAEPTTGNAYFDLVSSLRKQGLTKESYFIGANNFGGPYQQTWLWNSAAAPVHEAFWTVTIIDGKFVKEPQTNFGLHLNCAILDASRSHFINKAKCDSKQSFICETNSNTPPLPGYPQPSFNFFYAEEETTTSSNLHCYDGWTLFEIGASCHKFDEGPLSFYEAREHCETLGANLVAISDEEEDLYLKEKLGNYNYTGAWTGLIKTYSEGYHYVSGEPYEYSNWDERTNKIYLGFETCLEITPGGWEQSYCILEKSFICEKEATED